MKQIKFTLLILLTLVMNCSAQIGNIGFSGFADFFYQVQHGENLPDDFHAGQVELDFATSIAELVNVSGAIAYDPESETFGLGAFTADIPFHASPNEHFHRGGLDHCGIMFGLFDVPFGIDWLSYPSIDRKFVTSPLIVDLTHDSWNDTGVLLQLCQPKFQIGVFAVNGFNYTIPDEPGVMTTEYITAEEFTEDDHEMVMTFAAGTRASTNFIPYTEIGVSYAGFLNGDNSLDMSLFGADLQFDYQKIHLKGEFIAHTMNQAAPSDNITNTGFYAQALYSFEPLFVMVRQNSFNADLGYVDDLTRTDLGVGWVFKEGFELRVEHQIHSEDDMDVSYLQAVVGF